MRQLITLPHDQAHLLADFLLTLNIPTRLDDEAGGTVVWIREEDHLNRAREELAAFQKNPNDPRYPAAGAQAREIRLREQQADTEYERRQDDFRDRMAEANGPTRFGPVTFLLIAASVIVALQTKFGEDQDSPLYQGLLIAPVVYKNGVAHWDYLKAITEKGEVWRLVTPIFLHIGILHLGFNMLMLAGIGSVVEQRLRSGAYLGLVVLIAVLSNLAEYHVNLGFNHRDVIEISRSPLFGGMSGVLYGLFGYLWMVARASEEPERVIAQQTVFVMLIWLVICMSGAAGPVANTAHLVGLLVGVGVGLLAARRRR